MTTPKLKDVRESKNLHRSPTISISQKMEKSPDPSPGRATDEEPKMELKKVVPVDTIPKMPKIMSSEAVFTD